MFFSLYLVLVFVQTIFRLKLSCRVNHTDVTRREIKNTLRQGSILFGILFTFIIIGLIRSYVIELKRDDCDSVPEFVEVRQVGSMIITMSTIISLFMFFSMCYTCYGGYQRFKAKKANPAHLSSDEEDDAEFISGIRDREAFQGDGNGNNGELNPLEQL